jgi:prolyl oligopeptidase
MNPTPDAPDDDPFLWLEQVEGSAAVGWVEAETVLTLARFGGAGFARDRDTLAAMWDRDDKIPFVTRRGGEVYNFWLDAHAKRGLWRRAPWASYRDGEPAWDVLLDLDALAAAEGEDWTWAGAAMRPGDRRRALLKLSRGGGDACVLREYDLEAKAFVDGGFVAPEAKQSAEWVDENTLLICSAHGEGQATRSGYARTARLWRRGEPFEAAQTVFEGEESDISAFAGLDRSVTPPRWVFGRRTSFFAYDLWVGDLAARTQIDAPGDADKDVHGDWLLVKPRSAWTRGDVTYPAGALLAAPLARPGEFTTLFEPGETRALEDYTWIGRKLALSMLDDLAPAFDVLTPEDNWRRERLDGVPEVGVVGIGRLDAYNEESDGSTLAYVQDPLTPMEMRLFDLSGEPTAPTVLRRTPALFDASGLVVTRHNATAEDGERIPYVQVGPPREAGASLRLRRLRGVGAARLSLGARQALVGARRRKRDRQHSRRRRVRAALASGRRAREEARRAGRFRRRRRRSRAPRRDEARPHRGGGRFQRRPADRQHADAPSREVRRAAVHDSADRHAPLYEVAGGGELDRGIRRSRQARGLGVPATDIRLSSGSAGTALSADPHRDDPPR